VGWELKAIKSDVFDWSRQNAARFDAIVANLFLHHFSNEELVELFEAIASRTNLLVAVEPHRGRMSLLAGKFLWAIGCNSVTRHDAVVSIRAGFYGSELTALWPKVGDWRCEERQEGFASYLFIARREVG